jgi:hypothetical protein
VAGRAEVGASQAPVSLSVVQVSYGDGDCGEPFDDPSVIELAKRYAFQSAAVGSEGEAMRVSEHRAEDENVSPFAPRRSHKQSAAAASKVLDETPMVPLSEQANSYLFQEATAPIEDERRSIERAPEHDGPLTLLLRLPLSRWTNDIAVAIVIIGLIGGLVALLALKSLAAPEPALGVVPTNLKPTALSDYQPSLFVMTQAIDNMTVPSSEVEVLEENSDNSAWANGGVLAEPTNITLFSKPLPSVFEMRRPIAEAGEFKQ